MLYGILMPVFVAVVILEELVGLRVPVRAGIVAVRPLPEPGPVTLYELRVFRGGFGQDIRFR